MQTGRVAECGKKPAFIESKTHTKKYTTVYPRALLNTAEQTLEISSKELQHFVFMYNNISQTLRSVMSSHDVKQVGGIKQPNENIQKDRKLISFSFKETFSTHFPSVLSVLVRKILNESSWAIIHQEPSKSIRVMPLHECRKIIKFICLPEVSPTKYHIYQRLKWLTHNTE